MNNENKDEVVYLYLDDIIPNRFQPRIVFDEKALKELAVSIREHGVIQPIIVRNVNGKYEIIAGERRYKASALAGLTKIPAIIRELDDKESSKVALLENLQRKNLSPIEEARTYQKILEIDQMTQEDLAKTMGKSQSSVANKLRLLSLPDEVQDALLKEQISERHARSLLSVPDSKKQKELLRRIINEKMTVKSLDDEIKQLYPKDNVEKEITLENNFVDNRPLMPTTDLSDNNDNYGTVKIAPPDEDLQDGQENKFINYGEVDSEEETEKNEPSQLKLNSSVEPLDINELKENSSKIDSTDSTQVGGLDSLLNLSNSNVSPKQEETFKFINSLDNDKKDVENMEEDGDYFKPIDNEKTQLISPDEIASQLNTNKYTIDEASDKIKKLVDELKQHGLEISLDEMNFDKTYQIMIKINKE